MEIKVWVLTGVIGVLCVVLWWMLRLAIRGIYRRLDELIKQNIALSETLIKLTSDMGTIKQRVLSVEDRLNNHAERIRKLEIDN